MSTFLLADVKPPRRTQISAASGVARNLISARPAAVSFMSVAPSPPPTTAGWDPLIDGKAKNLASVPTLACVSFLMFEATKSPSYTMAPCGGVANTLLTDWANGVDTAPWVPPTRSLGLLHSSPSVRRAAFTDGSVHGIWCFVSLSYLSAPACRRYTFSNQSVSVHPSAPPMEIGATPESERVCAALRKSGQVAGSVTPALVKAAVLYQTVDLLAALKKRAYSFPSTEPRSRHTEA